MRRRTKIVATIGPASSDPGALRSLLAAGADVVRLNLSHGDPGEHLARLHLVRATAAELGRPVAVLVDLPGPKVRAGPFPAPGFLHEGDVVALVEGAGPSSVERIVVADYPSLLEDITTGDTVILGDGAITLRVESVGESSAAAVCVTGGRVQGSPGVHLPAERLRLHAPTDEDLMLVDRMAPAGPDFVAVSFVRRPQDLHAVRAAAGPGPMLVAKVETAPAVADLAAVLDATDAVMVARGDLGIECPLEDVPHLQKHIIRACVDASVPVITATQMLESMITSPAPTRAEASDVANAVLDGTDAVMLSAETAIGHDPAHVVATMGRLVRRAEAEADYERWGARTGRRARFAHPDGPDLLTWSMAHAAWQAAYDVRAAAVVCCTRSGTSARAMARFRPTAPLYGLSPSERTVRQMALSWGVEPMLVPDYATVDDLVHHALGTIVGAGAVAPGDVVVVLAGAPDSAEGVADVVRLVRV